MDKKPKCKIHNKSIKSICMSCNTLLCYKCLSDHSKKGCKFPMDLVTYASERIVPKYKKQIEDYKRKKKSIEISVKGFINNSEAMKVNLEELKGKLEEVLEKVNNNIEMLARGVDESLPLADTLMHSLTSQCQNLEDAIEAEDMSVIVQRIEEGEVMNIVGASENEKKLIQEISKTAAFFAKSEQLEKLNSNLKKMVETYQKFAYQCASKILNKNIFGTCSFQDNFTKLCMYDIQSKKMTPSITVPQWCTITQIGSRAFVSGGSTTTSLDTVYEFIEITPCLIPMESMNFPKYCHRTENISPDSFVTVGGENGSGSIPQCEEYNLSENKWKLIPSLLKARNCTGTALVGKYLYAIGGKPISGEIEQLDINEKKAWVIFNLISNGVSFKGEIVAFPISYEEIITFRGGNETEISIINLKTKSAIKYEQTQIGDYYRYNTVCQIGRNAYIIGLYGNIHIYKISEHKSEEIEYKLAITN